MELIEGFIADQVRPQGVVGRPHRGVDEHGHGLKSTNSDTVPVAFVGLGAMK
jgi:hypothetical protein